MGTINKQYNKVGCHRKKKNDNIKQLIQMVA